MQKFEKLKESANGNTTTNKKKKTLSKIFTVCEIRNTVKKYS